MNHRAKTPHSKTTRGFTLAEAIVGMGLMTILITGVLQMLKQANYLTELARDRTQAAQIIQDELDQLRMSTWDELKSLKDWEKISPSSKFASAYGSKYYLYREIKTTLDEKKDITVIAIWYDSSNTSQQSLFSTRITKGGINDYYSNSI